MRWGLSVATLLIPIASVIEVNIGIMCSCLLAFPAFFDRYGIHGLGSLVDKLISHGSSRREEKQISDTSGHSHKTRFWSRGYRSKDHSLDSDEYAKLHGHGNAIQMNGVKGNDGANSQHVSNKSNVSTEDAEAWAGKDQATTDHQASHRHTIERFDS